MATYVILHKMLSLLISLSPSGGLTSVWQIIAMLILARTHLLFGYMKTKAMKYGPPNSLNRCSINQTQHEHTESAVAMETRLTWAFSWSTEKLQTSHVSGSFSLLATILRMADR